MMSTGTGGWGRAVLAGQVAAAAVLAVACSRTPAGVDEARYDAEYRGPSAALTVGSTGGLIAVDTVGTNVVKGRDVPPDDDEFQLPEHRGNDHWHVLDTRYGPREDLHRLATQWHNTKTEWWFLVPVDPPVWRPTKQVVVSKHETIEGSHLSPVATDPNDLSTTKT